MIARTTNLIISALKDEMANKINTINDGYNTNPQAVLLGMRTATEVKTFPVLCISVDSADYAPYLGGDGTGVVSLTIYGYSQSDGIDNMDTIRDLASDAIHFVENDFSYKDATKRTSSIDFYGAGLKGTSSFAFSIDVSFSYSKGNI
jgi:hypothetical protein